MAEACQYKKCGHPLGQWVRSKLVVKDCYDIEERTCEKCGGKQTRFRSSDPETNKAISDLFKAMSLAEK